MKMSLKMVAMAMERQKGILRVMTDRLRIWGKVGNGEKVEECRLALRFLGSSLSKYLIDFTSFFHSVI